MKRIILNLAVFSSLSMSAFAQETPKFNSNIEVKAVVDAGCFLTAENLNFGVLQMPLQAQTANSILSFKCSKNINVN